MRPRRWPLRAVPARAGDTELKVYPKSQNRVALFHLGGIEYQLCESMQPDGRFATWIKAARRRGLHHICYEVDDIDAALAHAQAQGAALRICQACQTFGSHPHPEGWVAFLDNEAGGIEIEFMQVYTPEELEEVPAGPRASEMPAPKTVTVGTASAAPGTIVRGAIPVTTLAGGTPLEIPVVVINGAKPGPVLWVDGAIHGDEPEGPLCCQLRCAR
jgi:methylmalonyl-CoA/ethylmalonyl-CoA epimerase